MATCIRCAAGLRDRARFCTRCGAPVVAESPTVVESPAVVDSAVVEHEPSVAEDEGPPRPSVAVGLPPAASPEPGIAIDRSSTPEGEVPTGTVLTIAPEVPPLAKGRRWTAPPVRSHAATAAFITGAVPLLVSLLGNALAASLTADAAAQAAGGAASGAWTPVFIALALIFVINAALLTVCVITAGRGMRETANGVTRGRGLAVGGLVVGGLNLLLWLAGLVVTLTTLFAAFD